MGMTIDKAIIRYKNNAEYERTHGNLQGCLEFRQLAEWLEKYQKITKIEQAIQEMMKYEHDGFINISLARLDEILKKCGVKE